MGDDKKQKPEAGILSKPIHHKQTRKVTALPQLVAKSKRPDGVGASKVDDGPEEGKVPKADAEDGDDEPRPLMTEEIELAAVRVDDGGLFDDLFGDLDDW